MRRATALLVRSSSWTCFSRAGRISDPQVPLVPPARFNNVRAGPRFNEYRAIILATACVVIRVGTRAVVLAIARKASIVTRWCFWLQQCECVSRNMSAGVANPHNRRSHSQGSVRTYKAHTEAAIAAEHRRSPTPSHSIMVSCMWCSLYLACFPDFERHDRLHLNTFLVAGSADWSV